MGHDKVLEEYNRQEILLQPSLENTISHRSLIVEVLCVESLEIRAIIHLLSAKHLLEDCSRVIVRCLAGLAVMVA